MSRLIVTLTNGSQDKDLIFNIHDTDIAQRWKQELEKQYPILERNRFQGWPNSEKTLEWYRTELKKRIDTVNNYRQNTIQYASIEDQQSLNYLHKFFEELRGTTNAGTDFYNNAPNDVKIAVDQFNMLIHECEHQMRNGDSPMLVVTFKGKQRLELSDDDYEHFTFKWKYGEVYINYCEVGKPLLDIFKDGDTIVGKDAVKPQRLYSADFMIKFGPDVPDAHQEQRLKMFNEWYSKQTYNFKNLSLGMIPVASIEQGEPYSGFNEVKAVCVV